MKIVVLLFAVTPLASTQLLQALAGQALNLGGQQNQQQMQKNLNEVLSNGRQVVEQSRMQGVTTRLCSCQEQQRCVEHMQQQARECGQECWSTYDRIASNPQAMYQCAEQNQDLLTGMVSCLTNLVDSCSNVPSDRQIPKSNIAVMLSQIEERLKQNKACPERMLRDQTLSQMRDLVEVTMEYGLCVKKCFIQKNRQQGACFDHLGCQPFISGDAFQQASRRCTQAVQDELKSRAQQLCNCATQAGIRSSQGSCTVLNVVSNVAQGGGLVGGLARGGLLSALGGK